MGDKDWISGRAPPPTNMNGGNAVNGLEVLIQNRERPMREPGYYWINHFHISAKLEIAYCDGKSWEITGFNQKFYDKDVGVSSGKLVPPDDSR